MSFLRDLWNKEKKGAEPAVKQVKFQGDFGPMLADFEASYTKAEKLSRDLAREVETLMKLAKQLENTGTSYREKLKNALKTARPDDRRRLDILQEKVADLL